MELWVRSQDKSRLFKADNLYVDKYYQVSGYKTKEQTVKSGFAIWHNEKVIAQYGTKERCLGILDEVQKILSADPVPLLVFTNCDVTEDTYNGLNEMYKKGDLLALSVYSPQENVKIIEKSTVIYEMPEE